MKNGSGVVFLISNDLSLCSGDENWSKLDFLIWGLKIF